MATLTTFSSTPSFNPLPTPVRKSPPFSAAFKKPKKNVVSVTSRTQAQVVAALSQKIDPLARLFFPVAHRHCFALSYQQLARRPPGLQEAARLGHVPPEFSKPSTVKNAKKR